MATAAEPTPPHAPELSPLEEAGADAAAAATAPVIYEVIRRQGQEELLRPSAALFWSGLAAGLSMGFSLIARAVIVSHLPPDATWTPLVGNLGFTVGFLIVILGRQQLFTENTLTVMLPLLANRDLKTAVGVARLWSIVLTANLLGAAAVALVLSCHGVFEDPIRAHMAAIAQSGPHDFVSVAVRAVFAGWMLATVVWLLPAAEGSARLWLIVVFTWLVGAAGLCHVIGGSVEHLFAVWSGTESLGAYLGSFLAPAFLGNVVGGCSLVALLNHGQVIGGQPKSPEAKPKPRRRRAAKSG